MVGGQGCKNTGWQAVGAFGGSRRPAGKCGCSSVVERHVANGTPHYISSLKSPFTHSEPRFSVSAGSMKHLL